MKHTAGFRIALVTLLLTGFLVSPATSAIPSEPSATDYPSPYQLVWVDGFDSSTLDERWTWVREDASLWNLTDNPGNLQITSFGSLYMSANDQKNLLLAPAPGGDFRITTRVSSTPTENYHGPAIYVYQDDDNFIEVIRIYNNGQQVGIRAEEAGVPWSYYVDVTQNDILLRVEKEGDIYSSWYSEDNGATWGYIYQYHMALASPRVGLGVRMGPTTLPITADFNWMSLERILYNSEWVDGFNLTALDSDWSWLRENPSLWSLEENPGFMRIVSSGTIWQTSNSQENILLRDAPEGDFQITTRVVVSPTENYHGATLYVYQDDDNYIELARVYNNGQSVGFRVEELGNPVTTYTGATANNLLLRIVKEGDTYTGWFSEDDAYSWNYAGQYTIVLNNPRIGLSAKLGPTLTPVTVDWGFIRIESFMEKTYIPLLAR